MSTRSTTPIRPRENSECNQNGKAWGEKSDIDGMDEGHVDDSEDEIQAQEPSEAAMSEDVAAAAPDAEEVIHAEEAETQAPRVPRAPRTPSQQEIDDHEVAHCPFRSWCEHCVRGQAKDDPHRTVASEYADSSVVRVSMDYCFFTEGAKATETDHENSTKAAVSMTVMLMVESLFRSMWAYAVQCKGATDEWLAEQIKDDLETIGLAGERLIIKADQEPAITEVQRAVAAARATSGTAMEQARVGDSNSNGRVERAIQDFKGLTRTLRSALEARTGTKISLEDPIVPWMVRHAAQIINVCRVREDGQTAWQKMTGRRFYGKMVPFAEMVMFKIPKTKHRVGSFEDRWELGCWVGIVPRSGEHLVATDTGVHKVSTIKRRMASERWSAEWVKGIVGSPAEPMPGSTMRPKHRLIAYAKRLPDDRVATATYVPAAEPADIPEFRAAKIYQRDVETFGGSEKCPGCRAAAKGGKYKMSHTFECRQRFERLLKEDFRAKQRFDKAAERRWTGITNKAMAMDPTAPSNSEAAEDKDDAAATPTGAAGSGAGPMGDPRRSKEIDDQNKRQLQEGIKSSMQTAEAAARGTKRNAEEDADDYERVSRGATADTTAETKGVKRKDENQDDSQRQQDRADDMSSLQSDRRSHPGPVHGEKKFSKEDLEWNHIGSGMFARTFINADHMITTSKSGPPMMDVHRRIIRSMTTGRVLDDCITDEVSDEKLHRALKQPDNIRVELVMKGALKMFNVVGPDVSETFSQPRVAQEAGVQKQFKIRPGWSLDLTLDDPMTGLPWDLSKRNVRERVLRLVQETKPFMLIGSPPCTAFSSLQNLRRQGRDPARMAKELEDAKKHVRFCIKLYMEQVRGGRYFLHEHPENATSWHMPEVIELAAQAGVGMTVCDMCAYGMEITDKDGVALVRKSTKFLTNADEVAKRISRRCSNKKESGESSISPLKRLRPKLQAQHRHANILGGMLNNATYTLESSAGKCAPEWQRKRSCTSWACMHSR